jgi:glycosyltransferase involved in cell wall biosynthesis
VLGGNFNSGDEVKKYFDPSFYLEQINSIGIYTEEPWEHYLNVGWKLGYSPSSNFNIDQYWNANPDIFFAKVEPIKHWVQFGKNENRSFKISPWEPIEIQESLKQNFDAVFYTNFNNLTSIPTSDALGHFCRVGWRLGYDPNPLFDTEFYKKYENLESDYETPHFLHFLLNRKHLKRSVTHSRNRIAWDFTNIGMITPRIESRPRNSHSYSPPNTPPFFGVEETFDLLTKSKFPYTNKLLISWGNNNFMTTIGGIEVIVQRELNDCLADATNHVYIYRDITESRINQTGSELYNLTINGLIEIKFAIDELDQFLNYLSKQSKKTTFHLHGKIYSESSDVARIAAYAAERRYWVHDYSFICSSYTLMRNDIEFCSAPEASSKICQTCIAGSGRFKHLENHLNLLTNSQFTAISPSKVALEQFSQTFPKIEVITRPHLTLKRSAKLRKDSHKEDKKYRIAFTGHSSHHKGWNLFEEFVRHVASRNDFECFHLGNGKQIKNVKYVRVDSKTGISNMKDALIENDIDVVFQWSLWPETFCLVTAEALAAGCLVITNPGSGNTHDMAVSHNRGLVFEEFEELLESHKSGKLKDEVVRRKFIEKEYLDLKWNNFCELEEI